MKTLFCSAIMGLYDSELLMILFFGLLIALVPVILFLLTLQNTLNEVSPENRYLPPGQVWLMLIPLFGIVWQFIVVNRIADSLKAEFAKRNILIMEDRPGSAIGITYCILNCCSVIPFLGVLAGIGGLVCWIIYWAKISGYKVKLKLLQNPYMNQFKAS
jgi:hypothetical protein